MDLEPNLGVALDFAEASSWLSAKQLSIFELLKLDYGLATGLHVSTTTEATADLFWHHAPLLGLQFDDQCHEFHCK